MVLPEKLEIVYHVSGILSHIGLGIYKEISEIVHVNNPIALETKLGNKITYDLRSLENKVNRQLALKYFNSEIDLNIVCDLRYVIVSPLQKEHRAIVCEQGGNNGVTGHSVIYCGKNGNPLRPLITKTGKNQPHAMFVLYKGWEISEVKVDVIHRHKQLCINAIRYNGAFDIDRVPLLHAKESLKLSDRYIQFMPAVEAAMSKAYSTNSSRAIYIAKQ